MIAEQEVSRTTEQVSADWALLAQAWVADPSPSEASTSALLHALEDAITQQPENLDARNALVGVQLS